MFRIDLRLCRYTLQGIDITHLWPTDSMQVNEGPILVSRLDSGEYFVHDGRHRCIRGMLKGQAWIDAEWLDDWEADQQVAKLREALSNEKEERDSVDRTLFGGNTSRPRYDRSSPKTLCGKYYRHDPHDASLPDPNAPDEVCDGIPK